MLHWICIGIGHFFIGMDGLVCGFPHLAVFSRHRAPLIAFT